MTDLFARKPDAPLAKRLRTHALGEAIGQQRLISAGKLLQIAAKDNQPYSMLLQKMSGLDKTNLVHILTQSFNTLFLPASAVFSCVKDIRETIGKTQIALQPSQALILFTEQVYHFNKSINQYINKQLIENIVQFITLSGYSVGVKHG